MWMFNQISMLDVIFCIEVIIPYKLSSHVALLLTELYRFRLDLFRKIEPRRLSGNYFDMQEKPWAPNLSASTPSLFDEHIPHLPITRSSPFIRRGSKSKTVGKFDPPLFFLFDVNWFYRPTRISLWKNGLSSSHALQVISASQCSQLFCSWCRNSSEFISWEIITQYLQCISTKRECTEKDAAIFTPVNPQPCNKNS